MNSYKRFALWSGGADDKQSVTRSGDLVQFISHERQQLQVKVQIQPVQEGSGDPSPDNVRPIAGWGTVNVYRTGRQIWNEQWEIGTISTSTGEDADNSLSIRNIGYINVRPGKTYRIKTGRAILRVLFYNKNKEYISFDDYTNATVTIPENVYYLRFRTYQAYGTTYLNNILIGYPADNTKYEPYQGNVYMVQIPDPPGTVTDGVLDVTGGQLIVDGQVYQTEPQEITALIGTNTLWSDAGPVEVTYEQ